MVKQGDIIWLDFDPQTGYEQSGRRPAVVVSNQSFGTLTNHNLAMVCPISNTDKRFPTHVKIEGASKATGVVLCQHAKVLDIKKRNYAKFDELPEEILDRVLIVVGSIFVKE